MKTVLIEYRLICMLGLKLYW